MSRAPIREHVLREVARWLEQNGHKLDMAPGQGGYVQLRAQFPRARPCELGAALVKYRGRPEGPPSKQQRRDPSEIMAAEVARSLERTRLAAQARITQARPLPPRPKPDGVSIFEKVKAKREALDAAKAERTKHGSRKHPPRPKGWSGPPTDAADKKRAAHAARQYKEALDLRDRVEATRKKGGQ